MCSNHSSKQRSARVQPRNIRENQYNPFDEVLHPRFQSAHTSKQARSLILLDPYNQRVMRLSVCAVITFLSLVVWWSAWVPLTLAALALAAYLMGYRVIVNHDERKSKLKNDDSKALFHDIV